MIKELSRADSSFCIVEVIAWAFFMLTGVFYAAQIFR